MCWGFRYHHCSPETETPSMLSDTSSRTTDVTSSDQLSQSRTFSPVPSSPSSHTSPSTGETPSTPGSGELSTHLIPSSSGTAPTSPQQETISHPSSGPPSSELPSTSHSNSPSSTSLALPWSTTPFSPETETPSMLSDTSSRTALPGDPKVPESHRNPGMVVVVCLLVSVLLIGSVVLALRRCHQGEAEFQRLDEVSMETMNERSSFAHHPPK
ncbi:uncharacterized LOC729966 homolog isoform X3 [Elephas maximus indicus]|uniref:uncharacterized LOC729966 homolog isoform X3 n=1 Tax=Elephas maximus indicus TaxID=99487 RepID=UPI002116C6FB|nr:uncharacterized LOC729966 homolog isoform X3 [Elephas maximus indicus]